MRQILILILVINLSSLCAMEAPITLIPSCQVKEEEIPAPIQLKYEQEKKKFERYDLDQPEKFLKRFSDEFNTGNFRNYLDALRTFTNLLYYQHFVMQERAFISYLNDYYLCLRSQEKKIDAELTIVKPETHEQVNEILMHKKILSSSSTIYSPEEIKVIFSWVVDTSKGKWLNTLGYKHLVRYAMMRTQEEIGKKEVPLQRISDALISINVGVVPSPSKLVRENISYAFEAIALFKETYDKLKKSFDLKQKTIDYVMHAYMENQKKVITLYTLTHCWYEQLYVIMRKELANAILMAMRKNPTNKSLKDYLSVLLKDTLSPILVLPEKLSPWQKPENVITLPNITKELEEFRTEWQKTHPLVQPKEEIKKIVTKKIKRVRHKKEVSEILTEEAPAQAPDEPRTTPEKIQEEPQSEITVLPAQKIKEAIDKSYLLANEETDKNITIHDPKNKTIIKLFKTDNPYSITQNLPAKNYTDWVHMWFKSPEQALKVQGYTTINSPKFTAVSQYWHPIAIHAFPLLVDDYILQWGTLAKIPSRRDKTRQDFLVTIPGLMKYPNGKEETGVFAYLIDSHNGQWYHRMFEPQSGTKLIHDLFELGYFSPEMKGYYDVYFPPLGKK